VTTRSASSALIVTLGLWRVLPEPGTKRAVIAIDEQGVVRHRHDRLLGLAYQSVDDLRTALEALTAPAAR
jgi:hypothetical protein